jgi:hypothetical protein
MEERKSALVDISEIVKCYLPVSRKKARKFVALYLDTKKIGNRIYVERAKLEDLLADPNREDFPLEV